MIGDSRSPCSHEVADLVHEGHLGDVAQQLAHWADLKVEIGQRRQRDPQHAHVRRDAHQIAAPKITKATNDGFVSNVSANFVHSHRTPDRIESNRMESLSDLPEPEPDCAFQAQLTDVQVEGKLLVQTSTDLKAHVLRWNELNIQIDVHPRRGRALLEGLWARQGKVRESLGKSANTVVRDPSTSAPPKEGEDF